jgi:hypothetical protein
MPLLARRLLLAAPLLALASPAHARFTLPDADKEELLGLALPVLTDADVDQAFDTAQGRSMIALFVEGADRHVAARGCAGAPRGEALRDYSRALLVDMGRSAAAAVRAPLRLPAAFERLAASEGLARVEAFSRALADPNLRRYIDLHRPLHRAQLVDGLQSDIRRAFVRRGIAIFQDTGSPPSAAGATPGGAIDMSEALALDQRLKDDPAFRIYREMKRPMIAAIEATADREALRALANLSLVDRFRDRLAILCIG